MDSEPRFSGRAALNLQHDLKFRQEEIAMNEAIAIIALYLTRNWGDWSLIKGVQYYKPRRSPVLLQELQQI